MRIDLIFDPNGEDLALHLTFNAELIGGTYTYNLWNKNGDVVRTLRGQIKHSIAPIGLSKPVVQNDGSMIELDVTFFALDDLPEEEYRIKAEVLQGASLLGEPLRKSGPLPEATTTDTLFIFLKTAPAHNA